MLFRKRKQPSAESPLSLFDQARAAVLLLVYRLRLASPEKRRRIKRNRHRARKSTAALESLAGKQSLTERLCSLFIAPPVRRARPNVYFCHHSLIGLQALEARLCLTPVANNDSYHANSMATTNIPAAEGVLANDTGGSLTAVLASGPAHGSLTLNSDGSFSYSNSMPMSPDTFTYKAYDGTSYSSPATVSLNLMMNGAQPTANADSSYHVVHDHTLSVSAASGVLANDSDPNNIPLSAVLVSSTSHGSLTLNSDGSFTYVPNTHYTGSDTFQYYASNGYQSSSTVTDTINVTNNAPVANNDHYYPLTSTYTVSAASGVLANDYDGDGDTLTASLVSGPSHGTLSLNSDGSFAYTANAGFLGTDSFVYAASDGVASDGATVTLTVRYSVLSATDETKLPVDTIQVSRPILSDPFNPAVTSPLPAGGSGGTAISAAPAGGAPATAHNLSLVYNNVLAQPDQVIEVNIGLSTNASTVETITAALTFNGVAQPNQYFSMTSLNGTTSNVLLAEQLDTSSLASGRYPWSMTISSTHMQAATTVSGYVNVVNDSSSPFGKGWDMPGLYRLFNNSVSGVPGGVLLSTGDGGAWYFTAGSGSSYSSPAGPFAYSTLTSVTGGWQLVTHEGITFNFNSSGYLTSRVERTGETTDYTWTSGDLTSITDAFGRTVDLGYTSGLLSSIQDFAGNSWTIAHSGSNLTSITEPNPGYSTAPEWQYAYSGNYLASVIDPDSNETDFTLNGEHRVSSRTMPDTLTTSAVSEQNYGYGSTSSSSPANLTLATSVTPSSTDADGNTSDFQTDAFGDVLSETDAAGNTTVITRNSNGEPTVITLPPPTSGAANPVTDIYYDSTGDETYATGATPTYGTYTFTSDSFGQWATFTDVTGHEWTRTFDSSGDILTETDPSSDEASWTYNSYGRPLTMTLPAPNDASGTVTTHYYYDSDERLTEILWPDGTSQHFGYNSDDFPTSFEDEDGNTTTTDRDVLNRPTSVTNAASGVSYTTYDKDNNVLSTETPLGEVTSDEYNSMNELVQQTLPAPTTGASSPVLTWTYNGDGLKLTSTNALDRETQYAYNDLNEMTQETLPAPSSGATAPTIEFTYNNLGQQVSETNQLGGVTYTNFGNTDISQVTSVEQPPPSGSGTGPTISYSYDTDGRQELVTNALSQSTTTSFTVDGQVYQIEDNLGNITSNTYGHGGELISTTDPLSHSSSDEYDSRYRLVQTTDANSGVTTIGLDGVGNQVSLTDSDGNETDWTFNSLNLPFTETNALGTTTTGYNADAKVTSIEDADGRVRDFVYNNDQQLTTENWMSGSTVVATMSYGYDLAGELTSASDSKSAYSLTYNGDGQVTSTDNSGAPDVPDVVLSAAYDLAGDLTSQSATIAGTADFLNNYTFNADQQLTVVTQQGQSGGNVVSPKEIDYSYNALGQPTSMVDFNTLSGPRTDVLTGTYGYDGDSRLTSLDYTSDAGATTIDSLGYTYNAASLVTSFSSIDGTASYTYDPTNQLMAASYTTSSGGHQPANESYSFTANGNRDSTGYTTGDDNLMSSDGTYDYEYDADGNRTSRTQIASTYSAQYLTTYTWDYRNRLTDVEYYDNDDVLTGHVHFVYDVLNNLIGEEDDTTGSGSYDQEQWYVNEGSQPVLVFNGSGGLIQRNLIAPNPTGAEAVMAQATVDSLDEGDVVSWAADDKSGTPIDIVSNGGTVMNHTVDNAFGSTAYESDPSVTWWAGFGGGHFDVETNLILDGRRLYDPSTSKWLSQDPADFRGGDTDLSRYVGNGPTNGIDPSGEMKIPTWAPYAVTPMPLWPLIAMAQQEQKQQAQAQAAAALYAQMQPIGAANMAVWSQSIGGQQQAYAANQAQMQQVGAQSMAAWQQQAAAPNQGGAFPGAAAPLCPTAIFIAAAVMGQAGAPAAPAAPPGNWTGTAGGAMAGAGIGTPMGALGSTAVVVGVSIIGGVALGPAAVTVIAIGAGIGLVTGAVIGGYVGSAGNTVGAGATIAATNPATYYVPAFYGAYWAMNGYGLGGPPGFGSPYVNYPWWWPFGGGAL